MIGEATKGNRDIFVQSMDGRVFREFGNLVAYLSLIIDEVMELEILCRPSDLALSLWL